MFKVCGIIGNQESSFSIFLVLKEFNKIKKNQNILSLQDSHFSSNTNKNQSVFWFFTEKLTLSLPATHRAGHNADLPLNRNISKTVTVDIALPKFF